MKKPAPAAVIVGCAFLAFIAYATMSELRRTRVWPPNAVLLHDYTDSPNVTRSEIAGSEAVNGNVFSLYRINGIYIDKEAWDAYIKLERFDGHGENTNHKLYWHEKPIELQYPSNKIVYVTPSSTNWMFNPGGEWMYRDGNHFSNDLKFINQ